MCSARVWKIPFLGTISHCFSSFRNSSVCFGCFDIGSKHRNKPKIFFLVSRNKPKQTRNISCFGLFRFEPKYFFFHFEDTLPWSLKNKTYVCLETSHSNYAAKEDDLESWNCTRQCNKNLRINPFNSVTVSEPTFWRDPAVLWDLQYCLPVKYVLWQRDLTFIRIKCDHWKECGCGRVICDSDEKLNPIHYCTV